jgi:hypothetical protein
MRYGILGIGAMDEEAILRLDLYGVKLHKPSFQAWNIRYSPQISSADDRRVSREGEKPCSSLGSPADTHSPREQVRRLSDETKSKNKQTTPADTQYHSPREQTKPFTSRGTASCNAMSGFEDRDKTAPTDTHIHQPRGDAKGEDDGNRVTYEKNQYSGEDTGYKTPLNQSPREQTKPIEGREQVSMLLSDASQGVEGDKTAPTDTINPLLELKKKYALPHRRHTINEAIEAFEKIVDDLKDE